jgi:hypothetical protein
MRAASSSAVTIVAASPDVASFAIRSASPTPSTSSTVTVATRSGSSSLAHS